MYASDEDISALLRVQEIDYTILKNRKAFDALPQRKAILDNREQQAVIAEKLKKVVAMKSELDKRVTKILVEDEQLARKQDEVQAAIQAAGSDYRNLESRTKELQGHANRREVLSEQLEQLEDQVGKAAAMESQVAKMIDQLKAQEAKLIESFREQGGNLQAEHAVLNKERQDILAGVDPSLSEIYVKTAEASSGVAIGPLNGDKCGVCRNTLEASRLIEVRSQAPLARCPHCKRLLLVI